MLFLIILTPTTLLMDQKLDILLRLKKMTINIKLLNINLCALSYMLNCNCINYLRMVPLIIISFFCFYFRHSVI